MLLPFGVPVSPHIMINLISVLTESLGPIGQMAAKFAFMNGASRVIIIDANWRLDFVKEKIPEVETLDYSKLPRGTSVTAKLHEMVPRGPDVALECVAGEYAKGWAHYFELLLGFETDTSEILNEMITSVKNYGRCGITGVYVGYVSVLFLFLPQFYTNIFPDQPLQYRLPHGARCPPHR
jgi:threonine dehydrogenase-like Zn-dependent dehydrogenase